MKIKIVILEKSKNYLEKITQTLNNEYQDKFEVYSFYDLNVALGFLSQNKTSIALVSDEIDIDLNLIPKTCAFAYLTSLSNVDLINNKKAIYKYQQIDSIYKQILSVYIENSSYANDVKFKEDKTKLYLVSSPCGGVGTSTISAALAVDLVKSGNKTLYLNFEKTSSTKMFFSGTGKNNMSDIIYALKSRNSGLIEKLDEFVRKDKSDVYFYEPSEIALDMYNTTYEELQRLVYELKLVGSYDAIVIDFHLEIDKYSLEIIRDANAILFVGDGSETSNIKTISLYKSLSVLEESGEIKIADKIYYLYNKYHQNKSKMIESLGTNSIGGIPDLQLKTNLEIINKIISMGILKKVK